MISEKDAIVNALTDEMELWGAETPDQVAVPGEFLRDVYELLTAKAAPENKRKKAVSGLSSTLRYCHQLYNKVDSQGQNKLAAINQAAKDALEYIKDQDTPTLNEAQRRQIAVEVTTDMREYAQRDNEHFKMGDIIRMTPTQVLEALCQKWEIDEP